MSAEAETPHPNSNYPMRLQKFLARAGVASRRGSENLMTAGRVAINGEVVTELGVKVDPLLDVVAVDGEKIEPNAAPVYLILNKPTGYLTTMDDPQGRPTVAELVADAGQPALFPVGRLDLDTSGLLLFTTDGDLAYRVLHPKFELYKTYEATIEGKIGPQRLQRLRDGIELDDGPTAPAELAYDAHTGILTISIREGRNRQVRRMLKSVGHSVKTLHRTHFGPLALDALLQEGSWRHLDPGEITALKAAVTS